MFYAPSFWFKTYEKVLDNVPDRDIEESIENAVVVFYHVEAEDVDRKKQSALKTHKKSQMAVRQVQNKKPCIALIQSPVGFQGTRSLFKGPHRYRCRTSFKFGV